MGAGFLVSVRGAPRVGPEVEKRAKAEAQAALQRLLVAAAPAPPAEASDTVEEEPPALALTPVDVANRGCFVLLLTGGPSTPEAAGALVQAAYVALATAVSAGTAADDGLGFQYCDKILPLQVQLGAPTAGGVSEAVRALLGLSPPADGSSVAVLVHSRGDDVHGAAERGGAQLTSVETREAVLQATVQAGCGVNLQEPDWAVVVTCWRAAVTEAASAGIALVPGASIRTKPRLAPVRLPRPKVDPAVAAIKSKALKKRAQPENSSGGRGSDGGSKAGAKSQRAAVAAPVKLSAEAAKSLLRAALTRRSELLASVRPATGAARRVSDCWRLVHGTGDGFDGLTSDFLGLDASGAARVLIEAHHKWAEPAPLIGAVRELAAEGLLVPHNEPGVEPKGVVSGSGGGGGGGVSVYLKQRYLADARQSGGLLAPGATELPVPVSKRKSKKEKRAEAQQRRQSEEQPSEGGGDAADGVQQPPPAAPAASVAGGASGEVTAAEADGGPIVCSEDGLKFELSITRGEHIGLFFDSRTARMKVRELAAGRRVLNLFAFTGGMGVAAAAGGAKSTTNVDNKLSFLKIAERNYELNSLPHDSRTFCTEDAVRYMKDAVRDTWRRYSLIVLDPPPRFGRNRKQSDWEFDATKDFGKLLGLTLQLLDGPGAWVLAGFPCTAGESDEDGFEAMVEEAQTIAGCRLNRKGTIYPGEDFPFCPHRPTARFLLAEVASQDGNGTAATTSAEAAVTTAATTTTAA